MESLQFLREEVAEHELAERDRAPRPHARIEREVEEILQDFMGDKEVGSAQAEAPAEKVEVDIVKEEHDVRYGVDITAVEEDPVEKIDVSLPGKAPPPPPSSLPLPSSLLFPLLLPPPYFPLPPPRIPP